MATTRRTSEPSKRRGRPATTPEARENQLIAAAYDLAERQIAEGTVSAQVQSHFLKLGSTRQKLENEKLLAENALLHQKVEQLKSASRMEELYEGAIRAMRQYSGQTVDPEEDYAG
jgi:hypothetical protein